MPLWQHYAMNFRLLETGSPPRRCPVTASLPAVTGLVA